MSSICTEYKDKKRYHYNYLEFRKSKISLLYTFILIVMPIINQYKIFPIEFFDMFTLVFAIFGIIKLLHKIKVPYFSTFYIYCIFSAVFFGIIYGDELVDIVLSASRLLAIIIGLLLLIDKYFDFDFFKKIYFNMSFILSIVLFVQIIVRYIFGQPTFLLFPNITMNYGNGMNSLEIVSMLEKSVGGGYVYRPSALFIEPVNFAYYVLPAILLLLMERKDVSKKKRMVYSLVMTSAVVLTTSTTGIIGCGLIWIIYIMVENKRNKGKISYKVFLFAITVLVAFVVLLEQKSVQISIVKKLSELNNSDSTSSTSLRLLRGGYFFNEMSWINRIIGCGFSHIADYYYKFQLFIKYDSVTSNVEYMNSVFSILCAEGMIGFVLYAKDFCKLLFSKDSIVKSLSILFFLMMIGGSIMDSPTYFLILVVLCKRSYMHYNINV